MVSRLAGPYEIDKIDADLHSFFFYFFYYSSPSHRQHASDGYRDGLIYGTRRAMSCSEIRMEERGRLRELAQVGVGALLSLE